MEFACSRIKTPVKMKVSINKVGCGPKKINKQRRNEISTDDKEFV